MKKFLFLMIIISLNIFSQTDTLKYRYISVDIKFDDCIKLNEVNNCASFKLTYPEFYGEMQPEIKSSLESFVQGMLLSPIFENQRVFSYVDVGLEFVKEYLKFQNSEEAYNEVGWEDYRELKVEFNKKGILSLSFNEYVFTGGAHGMGGTLFHNLNVSNGRTILINSIIEKEKYASFIEVAEKEFRKQRGIKENETLNDAGYWFENNVFKLNDNFLIDENGLTFLFNQYEIAPYSYGTVEVLLPFEKIKSFLVKDSIVWNLISKK